MLWTFSQGQRIIDVSFLSHSFLGIFLFFVCLFYLYIEMPTVYVATILLYKSGWNTFSFWLKSNSALTVGKEEPLCTSGVWYEAVGHHSFFLFFFFSSSRILYVSDPTPNKPICWLQLHLVFGTGSPQCAGESSPGGCGEEKSATLPHSNPVPDLRVVGFNHNSCIHFTSYWHSDVRKEKSACNI